MLAPGIDLCLLFGLDGDEGGKLGLEFEVEKVFVREKAVKGVKNGLLWAESD